MWIKELILDGFKSYATRTVIKGFDPSFNAITGLNGSGKSNILDSICFVLGISNLSQVRVANLQELVYKHGQAGVTKATVTVVFDNSNKDQSPVGYDQFDELTVTRQVQIGGKNKYFVNGRTAQLQKVQNLFHSVQLNVNNPNFLIMQGRITKVLNMKPLEILGMVEETAGTRLFEDRKIATMKTLEKKQSKVEEIMRVLESEITPTLESLRGEREQFLSWQSQQAEQESLSRLLIAHQFASAEAAQSTTKEEIDKEKMEIIALREQAQRVTRAVAQAESELATLKRERKESQSGVLARLEEQCDTHGKNLVKTTAVFQHAVEALETEETALEKARQRLLEAEKLQVSLSTDLKTYAEQRSQLVNKTKEVLAKRTKAERQYQAVLSSGGESETTSIASELVEAKVAVTELKSKAEQLKLKIADCKASLGQRKKAAQKAAKGDTLQHSQLKGAKDAVEKAKREVDRTAGNLDKHRQLTEEVNAWREEARTLREKEIELGQSVVGFRFAYERPSKSFNDADVRGRVACLIHADRPEHVLPIEIAAGSKLYHVVIENENVGKALLESGHLKHRVTFVPLNKIVSSTLSENVLQNAKSINVNADALVSHVNPIPDGVHDDASLQPALNYAFGKTLLAPDAKTAQRVTFDPRVRSRTVTLNGDMFDPAGTLTGGSRPSASVLVNLHKHLNAEREALAMEARVAKGEQKLEELAPALQDEEAAQSEWEVRMHELTLLEARAKQSESARLFEDVKALEQETSEAEAEEREVSKSLAAASARLVQLEQDANNLEGRKQRVLKEAQKNLEKSRKAVEDVSKRMQDAESVEQQCQLSLADCSTDIQGFTAQIETHERTLISLGSARRQKEAAVAEAQEKFQESEAAVKEEQERLAETDEAMARVLEVVEEKTQDAKQIGIEQKRRENRLSRAEQSFKDISKSVANQLSKHAWISSERTLFGREGSAYDFSAMSMSAATARLKEIESRLAQLERRVNKKVLTMFTKAENEYNELLEKKERILMDKEKIEEVIHELDIKKKQTLRQTFDNVNRDFASIFSILLPGAQARLEPIGEELEEGVNVRAALGNVWKESLVELSGGQRSLLALSIILSLLLFKPAPMYILDEIDAALDLSHTQNIGLMLRRHFAKSQFLVVSLKEGMFNNANVLFRTSFVDGMSTVSRTALRESDRNEDVVKRKKK